jgi:TonB family protein
MRMASPVLKGSFKENVTMNKLTVLVALLTTSTVAGCATGRTFVAERDNAPHARVHLEFTGSTDTAAVFPAAIDPALPSVDRIGREVRGTLGDAASAQIDLCVSPAGNVTKASLVQGSSFGDFDQALLQDVNAWRFAAMPGPATVQTCERARITYRPY